MINSLSQLLVKIASPGVPDFYRGAELWDLNLVDPDNRRAVDFELRSGYLSQLENLICGASPPAQRIQAIAELLEHWEDGRIKLYFTAAGLRFRNQNSGLFLRGSYIVPACEGEAAPHVISFARRHADQLALVLAPRLIAKLCGSRATLPLGREAWGDTSILLPQGLDFSYQNILTGETHQPLERDGQQYFVVGDVLKHVPAAILYATGKGTDQG